MSVEIAMWRMDVGGAVAVSSTRLPKESMLEDLIADDPSVVGADLLYVGRQIATEWRGFIDVLGIDADGHVHVLELKRDRSPRDVVAQTLDYASWVQGLDVDDVRRLYEQAHDGENFDDAFAEHFGQPLPDVVNADQRLTIVASELDDTSDRIVEFLAERYGVPINAVFFRYFEDGGNGYLARTWLLDPAEAATRTPARTRKPQQPWNGRDYYVVLGRSEQEHGRWSLARDHGYVSAGGGTWYWKPLRNLEPGCRVFAYVGGAGYVGVGTVTGRARPARDVTIDIDNRAVPFTDAQVLAPMLRERAASHDDDTTEYVVPVEWLADTRDVDQAFQRTGLFASQLSACKLRDERTIRLVEEAFGLDSDSVAEG